MPIRISNTLSGQEEELVTRQPGLVNMYVCGVTVYASSHIGHAMSALTYDVIRRYLEYRGYQVRHVINFTDIDDNIITRSQKENVAWQSLTERYIAEYLAWMDALNVKRATVYPRATQEINEIVSAIAGLVEKGYAYPAANGDVYYEVARKADYGELKHQSLDELRSGARVEIDEDKKSPLDFVLWKAAKPGEPSWPSPWGNGRPGWHIECSAMALHHLGEQLDIHGGGTDLIFPHHENEIAQSEALTGQRPFVRYWVHNGMLQAKIWDPQQNKWAVEKMSKSLGNTMSVGKLLEMGDPDMLRMFVLGSHYSKPLTYTDESFQVALRSLERLKRPFAPEEKWPEPDVAATSSETDNNLQAVCRAARQNFEAAMDDNFNTSLAQAALFELVREIFKAREAGAGGSTLAAARELLAELGGVLGFRVKEIARTTAGNSEPFINLLVKIRSDLKTAKQFELADSIRQQLKALGIVLEDRKGGETTWKNES